MTGTVLEQQTKPSCGSEQQRVACAIGGIYTILAIEKVLPIMHSGPGCQQNAGGVLGRFNGAQSGVSYPESVIPSTNFCERDVVFGATGRLRQLVAKSMDYYQSDMFFIVDGCTSEIVGDDIEEVAGDFQDRGKPVLFAKLPGFKGNNLWGHSQILNAIINQHLEKPDHINDNQVNIFGIVPYYDSFWQATLEELEKLLRVLGLEPNNIYGRGKGVPALQKIPEAAFNLVLAPWTDLDTVEKLQEKFGTPFFHYPCVPIGPTETARFVWALTEYAGLDKTKSGEYIQQEESRYYYYIKNAVKVFGGGTQTPRKFFVNSSAAQTLSLTRFLVNDWWMTPQKIFIIDDVPEKHQERITGELRNVEYDRADEFDVVFTTDGGLCDVEIKKEDFLFKKACLFGTAWDQLTANYKQLPFVRVSAPYGDSVIGNKTYFGWNGALTFLQDLHDDITSKILGSGVVVKFDDIGGH
jgi:nitrogenase molybdenum-iron protein beta chain